MTPSPRSSSLEQASGLPLRINSIEVVRKVVSEGCHVFRERKGEPGQYDAKPHDAYQTVLCTHDSQSVAQQLQQ